MPKKDMVEVRVFLPRKIVERIDEKRGLWGNTRSEIVRHIVINALGMNGGYRGGRRTP